MFGRRASFELSLEISLEAIIMEAVTDTSCPERDEKNFYIPQDFSICVPCYAYALKSIDRRKQRALCPLNYPAEQLKWHLRPSLSRNRNPVSKKEEEPVRRKT